MHLTYFVAVDRAAALIYHRITTLDDAVDGRALIGKSRSITKICRVGNKITISIGAAEYSQGLISIPLNATLKGKAGASGSGHAIIDGVWHTVHIEVTASIAGSHGIGVRAAIKAIDDSISIRVIISPFAVGTS